MFSEEEQQKLSPIFLLIRKYIFNNIKSNNEIGNWHKAIAELIGKKSGTVKQQRMRMLL